VLLDAFLLQAAEKGFSHLQRPTQMRRVPCSGGAWGRKKGL
jgi:hypothetical protein